ncbi:MAG: sigma-70 family RNA polymerase sigma factor [Lachnospiraceae bacterium]|nr:sigma-70 family RNA polymerase sigma factor [Lachnospiraceae bacterium]
MIATNEFEKLIREHWAVVYRFLLSLCGDAALAEELTSETFYQAYLHIDRFRGECRPETWLCQIAKNALYRENKRTKRTVPWEQNDRATEEAGILEQLVKKEQALNIYRHIHELDDPYKEVFMLRILGELKFKEISAVYGKTESWAKVTFYRAKNKLIELMEDME